ncbi:serine protease ea-like [Musca autumnalis]|uniref:serine protease ea-like n=1 Tax=Musca autumnalis TaxID=221902 RepID=UPI003CF8B11B
MFASLARNVCLLIIFCATVKATIVSYSACTNPHNEKGICMPIIQCNYLLDMMHSNATAENRKFLAKSQCGNDGSPASLEKRILVCCLERHRHTHDAINNVLHHGHNKIRRTRKETLPGNKLPRPGECGVSMSNRILRGNITDIDEFPWMALIQIKTGPSRFHFNCGGSLINSRYVLTAGHCVKFEQINWELYAVRLGEWNLTVDPDCLVDYRGRKECMPRVIDIRIDYAIVHPAYIPASREHFHDIAIIRLKESVAGYPHLIPICLPVDPSIRYKKFTKRVVSVAGWGATENSTSSAVKLKAKLRVGNIPECQKRYRKVSISLNSHYQMCASGVKGVDSCTGDSGGALMVQEHIDNRNVYFAVGMVSFGPVPCASKSLPGVYTRIGNYIDWIIENLLP